MAPFGIRGVLWYQGETDADNPAYAEMLTSMIRHWRALWRQPDLPFVIAQLAGYGENVACYGPRFRSLQRQGNALVVTFDVAGNGLVAKDVEEKGEEKGGQSQFVLSTGHRRAALVVAVPANGACPPFRRPLFDA